MISLGRFFAFKTQGKVQTKELYDIDDADDVWAPDEYGFSDGGFLGEDTWEDQKGMEELKKNLKIPDVESEIPFSTHQMATGSTKGTFRLRNCRVILNPDNTAKIVAAQQSIMTYALGGLNQRVNAVRSAHHFSAFQHVGQCGVGG